MGVKAKKLEDAKPQKEVSGADKQVTGADQQEKTLDNIPSPEPSLPNVVWRCSCLSPGTEWAKFGPAIPKHIKQGRASGDGNEHNVFLFDADTGELLARSAPEATQKGLIGKHKGIAYTSGRKKGGVKDSDLDFGPRSTIGGKVTAATIELPMIDLLYYEITKDAIESRINPETGQHYKFTDSFSQWIDNIIRMWYAMFGKAIGLDVAILKSVAEVQDARTQQEQ